MRLEVGELIDAGEHVVQIGHTQGTMLADGAAFRLREVHVWCVRDGTIVSYRAYVDTPGMLTALTGRTAASL